MTVLELDAIIVGAGFSGIYILHLLRDELHLNVKILEARSDVGGVWNRNVYPGARVDCPTPVYAFDIEKVYRDWKWSQAYPSQQELQAYFRHVDQALSRWTVKTDDGKTVTGKYLIPAVGFADKQYVPAWKGLDSFQGTIYHTSLWPHDGVDVRGKRVAVIGTGATGVQIIQEWAKEAAETLVFQRTPNLALPMKQKSLDSAAQSQMLVETREMFNSCQSTFGGMPHADSTKAFSDYSSVECEKMLGELYDKGGFHFWGGLADLLVNTEANRFAYGVWAKRVRARVHDPVKRDLLAPLEPPHPWGTKRPSLEQNYYEQFNKPNVHIVDTQAHPIMELTPKGIITDDQKLYEVDVIAIATGFDSSTGTLAKMGLQDLDGVDLALRWREGILSFLGMTVPGFPNMFLPYSIQCPTPLTNGPVFIKHQAKWIQDMIRKMETTGIHCIDPSQKAAQAWREEVLEIAGMTLFPQAKSWYQGANIPGKHIEQMYYLGGVPMYLKKCSAALGDEFLESFIIKEEAT
ncbi:hypothetical protein N7474_011236 [Penicillium riverlandense]|uniref:uncharacterized protein n=1 Tax=Penicillium riverlandense TaxID=1903569 RepID=UPI00254784A7|nr:uncharacterized protein N7474_011236 [Penicillium riverlandense]KAJ5805349.1 hypothetical protein N7474_011236 [Penicillium riverlandense]